MAPTNMELRQALGDAIVAISMLVALLFICLINLWASRSPDTEWSVEQAEDQARQQRRWANRIVEQAEDDARRQQRWLGMVQGQMDDQRLLQERFLRVVDGRIAPPSSPL
ncbi:hypothetical protein F53441_8043 [Fusarium austroafricanum]|uniref:Uncharacterized protein n=1 Tax=Fusarium austroafricanum TaxID=2364996 RepID=A0A8H4KEE3_9HYPO|nr:hypothetical protein F53441_8043 [Fusarium austroafricanum]